MNERLASLNAQQRRAVTLPLGPALILAGPGSGKTRVLTHRVAYLVHELGAPPWSILAVTFTNKAAAEMKARVAALLSDTSGTLSVPGMAYGSRMSVGTFHSVCARILRIENEHIPYDPNWGICDAQDQRLILRGLLKNASLEMSEYELSQAISRLKGQSLTPEEHARNASNFLDQRVSELYAAYQNRLRQDNAMDFDDLLMQTLLLLRGNQAVREKYRRRWPHVLVDEFQDTNLIQYQLLRLLTLYPDSDRNLFAVGDEDQSIYAFRGANYRNLQQFQKDFHPIATVLLERNYRSTPQILDVANSLIAHNRDRARKHLFTEADRGQKVVLLEAEDSQSEAEWVAQSISALRGSGFTPDGIAVMYRTNAQSRALEEGLLREKIPYRIVGGLRFYDRAEIKDALAYLRLIVNPRDSGSLLRIINRPTRGIGRTTIERMTACRRHWTLGLSDVLRVVCEGPEAVPDLDPQALDRYPPPFPNRALSSLRRFHELVTQWRLELAQERRFEDAGVFLDHVCETSGYHQMLERQGEEAVERRDNLEELISTASNFDAQLEADELALHPVELFLVHAGLVSAQDEMDDDAPKVSLMTLHTSKGLEFPAVYLTGMDEGLLPHARATASEEPREMEEERRLCYVGVTRAMKLLFLTHAVLRERYGGVSYSEPSRFLDEIPDEFLRRDHHPPRPSASPRPFTGTRTQGSTPRTRRGQSAYSWADTRESARPSAPRYRPAMKVRHPHFGIGTVIGSEMRSGDEEVSVFFQEHGLKRLAVAFANLKVMD